MTENFVITAGASDSYAEIFEKFIQKLQEKISAYGYEIIDKDSTGRKMTIESYDLSEADRKLLPICHDFYIKKGNSISRTYRLEVKNKNNTLPYISVLKEELIATSKNPNIPFRNYEQTKEGRSYFFTDYIINQRGIPKWRKGKINMTAEREFKIIVNDDMLLVFCRLSGGMYVCCLSFIKLYDIFDETKYAWLSNSSFSEGDYRLSVDIPLNLKGKEPYAKLGMFLKATRLDGVRFGTGNIIVLPKVTSFATENLPIMESYTYFFDNEYNRFGATNLHILNTIQPISTKLVVITDKG